MRASVEDCVRPSRRIAGCEPYASPTPPYPIDLWLNGNEGAGPPAGLIERVRDRFAELVRRYPDAGALQALLAERFGLSPDRVLITAGADDALYRACMVMLDPERDVVLPTPTFEMLDRYSRLAGGRVVEVEWLSDACPVDAMIAAVTDRTAMVVVVSPNNPTGAVATADDLRRLSAGAPQALLLVDIAYGEFGDEDLTPAALALPNALVARTLSKAWGLAGLRVGYALGPPHVIRWLKTVGNPYAVSGVSLALAAAWVLEGEDVLEAFVGRVREERTQLAKVLREVGADPVPSQANLVLARFADAAWTWERLARRGIAVRAFPGHRQLSGCLRITCPGEASAFARLVDALRDVANERVGEE